MENISLTFLRTHATKETLEALAIETKMCLECGRELHETDEGLTCTNCGIIWSNFSYNNKIPFGETRAPTCSLDKNNSLGSCIGDPDPRKQKQELFKVLAVNYKDNEQSIPLYQIKTMMQRNKHPIIESMEQHGSRLMDKYINPVVGRDSETSHIFAQKLGKTINKVGLQLIWTNNGRKAKAYTEAIFLYVWRKMNIPNASKLRQEIKRDLPEIKQVINIMEPLTA